MPFAGKQRMDGWRCVLYLVSKVANLPMPQRSPHALVDALLSEQRWLLHQEQMQVKSRAETTHRTPLEMPSSVSSANARALAVLSRCVPPQNSMGKARLASGEWRVEETSV